MEKMTLAEIVQATGGVLTGGDASAVFSDISTDSRSIGGGMLFVALVGANFDGNDYAKGAIEHGAVAVVVSKDVDVPGAKILVDDTLKALGDIATYYRDKFNFKIFF